MATGLSFNGLASGIDTDGIVTALMRIERAPQTRLQTRIDSANARLAGFQDTRGKLDALRTAAQALRAVGSFGTAPYASSSDTARLTATATGSAVKASYSVEVQGLARAEVRTQSSTTAAAAADDVLHLGAGQSFDVAVAAGDTVAAIAGKINAAGGDVAASVADGKLRLTARETGTAHAVSITSDGALAGALAFGTTVAAADARLRVDGTDYVRSSNTVTDVVAGTTLNLKAATGATPIMVETDPDHLDVDGIVAKAKAFVSAHNAVVDTLRTAAGERRGLFANDSAYTSILDRLRRATSNPVSGAAAAYDQASEIGLSGGASTGSLDSGALSGRLVLDETRLRAALANDSQAVERLLAGDGGTPDEQGIAARAVSIVGEATGASGVLSGRIDTETRRIADFGDDLTRMGARLDARETFLRRQFTAMETALGQLQTLQGPFPSSGFLGAAA